jgi:hypothetical protein
MHMEKCTSPIPPMVGTGIGKERPMRAGEGAFRPCVVFPHAGIAKFSGRAQIMGKAFTGCAG